MVNFNNLIKQTVSIWAWIFLASVFFGALYAAQLVGFSLFDNTLLKANNKISTTKRITKSTFIKNFKYHYYSEHIDKEDKKLRIYHLMFDFNKNMPH